MKLKEMREQVKAELEHIPGWPKPQQSELRMVYWTSRMHSLGKKAEVKKVASEVLQDCIKGLKRNNPKFDFQYDPEFFENGET